MLCVGVGMGRWGGLRWEGGDGILDVGFEFSLGDVREGGVVHRFDEADGAHEGTEVVARLALEAGGGAEAVDVSGQQSVSGWAKDDERSGRQGKRTHSTLEMRCSGLAFRTT